MSTKKVILYYQTFTTLKPILFPGTPITHIHLSAIHFGRDNNKECYIEGVSYFQPPLDKISKWSAVW